ncbi:septation protein SpoVG family protein [Lacunimicrobium album]
MEITEVRIKLMEDPHDRLQAFCSITIDHSFVVRDLKIIQGIKGPFVAMPSRKLMDRCAKCKTKNHLRSNYCNHCGSKLHPDRVDRSGEGRVKLYADIAHPINSECREEIQNRVIDAFEKEMVAAKQPGYVCRYDDYGEDDFSDYIENDYLPSKNRIAPPPAAPVGTEREPQFFEASGRQHRVDSPGVHSESTPVEHIRDSTSNPPIARATSSFGLSHGGAMYHRPHDEDFGTGIL